MSCCWTCCGAEDVHPGQPYEVDLLRVLVCGKGRETPYHVQRLIWMGTDASSTRVSWAYRRGRMRDPDGQDEIRSPEGPLSGDAAQQELRFTRPLLRCIPRPSCIMVKLRFYSSTCVRRHRRCQFLGSHLCDCWRGHGSSADNLITGNVANIEHLSGNPDFRFIKHDVTEYLYLPDAVNYIFHFASPASPIDYLELPIQTLKVGALGTHKALGLARAKKARLLLASTSEVYGDPLVHPQPEPYWGNVNPIGPRGVYDEAKRFAEAMVMAYHRYHGVETRIVRIFNTYGPRMRPNDGRVVPAFIVQALKGEPMTVFGDGHQTRSFCYV